MSEKMKDPENDNIYVIDNVDEYSPTTSKKLEKINDNDYETFDNSNSNLEQQPLLDSYIGLPSFGHVHYR